ncbi:hypothetical protein AU195_14395 [Mycobacterium sp. IS-1496]|nr:hypothetical protein AU195_14395 [Mycobacterium sp. IS-1496]
MLDSDTRAAVPRPDRLIHSRGVHIGDSARTNLPALVYQTASYDHWRRHLDRDDLTPGCFGENFTVDGLADDEVCIGDRYRIGGAEFEVTQPRVTCFRVGMRLGEPRMPNLLVAHHRPGFYLRVITEGVVAAGDVIVRTRRGRHGLSVAAVDALLYLPGRDVDTLRKAVDIPRAKPGLGAVVPRAHRRRRTEQAGLERIPTAPGHSHPPRVRRCAVDRTQIR